VAFPTFEITLKEDSGARAPDEDGMTAVVLVRNVLPCVRLLLLLLLERLGRRELT